MRGTLVTVLREVGLFTPEIPYDKPGVMRAFRHMSNGQRNK